MSYVDQAILSEARSQHGLPDADFQDLLSSLISVRVRNLQDLDEGFCRSWQDLERSAIGGNPFASADFVRAAARRLPGLITPLVLSIERGDQLIGLGVFEQVAGSRRIPLPHLRSWQTPYTYFDGLLLRSGLEAAALRSLWNFFSEQNHKWHAVEFPRFPVGEPLTNWMDQTADDAHLGKLSGTCWERASLHPAASDGNTLLQTVSTKRAKSLRRGWRELESGGSVQFEFVRGQNQMSRGIDELLELEALGWKSEVGTALKAKMSHEAFFRDMVTALGLRNQIFFSRLKVKNKTVASVVNLVSGDMAYAFKLGWDPAWERGCPGYQIKAQTVIRAGKELPGIRCIDSCSSAGSFIEHVWPQRRQFCTRTYVTSRAGQLGCRMVNGLRRLRSKASSVSDRLFRNKEAART